jgi:hypothetical protein
MFIINSPWRTCRFSRAVLGFGWKRLFTICQVALSLGPERFVAEPVVVLFRAQQHVFDPKSGKEAKRSLRVQYERGIRSM